MLPMHLTEAELLTQKLISKPSQKLKHPDIFTNLRQLLSASVNISLVSSTLKKDLSAEQNYLESTNRQNHYEPSVTTFDLTVR